MTILLKILGFVSVCYASIKKRGEAVKALDNQTLLRYFDEMIETRARETTIRKKLISKALIEEELSNIPAILDDQHGEYKNSTTEDIETSIRWDSVFSKKKEREIRRICKIKQLKDDFVIRLVLIIEELYYEMFIWYEFGSKNEYCSREMLNDLYFLKEICQEYILECEYLILQIATEFLLLHYLEASIPKDKRKISEIISRIKIHDKELRISILPRSRSLLVLNNIFDETPGIGILLKKLYIPPVPRNFLKSSFLAFQQSIIKTFVKQVNERGRRPFLYITLDCRISMEYIYEKLGKLIKNWKATHYNDIEGNCIFFLYLTEFCCTNDKLISSLSYSIGGYSKHVKNLSLLLNDVSSRLSSHLNRLLPVKVGNVVNRLFSGDSNALLKICLKTLISVVDYRRHLTNRTAGTLSSLRDLEPSERFRSILAVIKCYNAHIGYICDKYKNMKSIISYDFEAMDNICKIILWHFENMESLLFDSEIDKYVALCSALKKLSSKIISSSKKYNHKTFSDYPHLIEFYEEYHKTGLKIDSINNICFIFGISYMGTMLRLHRCTPNHKAAKFYNNADLYGGRLRKMKYDIYSYNEQVDDTLDHIMRCIVEMRHNNYDNTIITRKIIHNEYDCEFEFEENLCNTQSYLNMIKDKFWPKIYLHSDIFDTHKKHLVTNCSLQTLYYAKYISETDVSRLYNEFRSFRDFREDLNHDSLLTGVKNRKFKNKIGQVICNIILNVFKLIKTNKIRSEHSISGYNAAQILFKNLNESNFMNLKYKIVLELYLTTDRMTEEEISIIVDVLGVYAALKDIQTPYLEILRSKLIVIKILSDAKSLTTIEKRCYGILRRCCESFDRNIDFFLEKLDSVSILNFSTQLSIALEAFEKHGNDSYISSGILKFLSQTLRIIYKDIDHDIFKLIENIITSCHNMVIKCSKNTQSQAYILSCLQSTFHIFVIVYKEIETITENITSDFIDLSCSVIAEICNNIEHSEETATFETSKYKILINKFLTLINELDGYTKWALLYSTIVCKTQYEPEHCNSMSFKILLMMISNVLSNNSNSCLQHATFINDSYEILMKFFLDVDSNMHDYSSLDDYYYAKILPLVKQDSALFEALPI